MKKIILPFYLIGLMSLGVMANGSENSESNEIRMVSLSGKVMDMASGEVLSGVKVVVEKEDLHTYTDFDGNFSFESLKPGTYQVSAAFISYEKAVQKINANEPAVVNLLLGQLKEK